MTWETGWCDECGCPIGAGACGGCIALSCVEADDYEPECCPHCGKEFEDFSDLGCEHCDQRHPGYRTLP